MLEYGLGGVLSCEDDADGGGWGEDVCEASVDGIGELLLEVLRVLGDAWLKWGRLDGAGGRS